MSEVFDRDRIHRKLTELSAFWRHRIDGWRDDGTEAGTEKRHAQQLWSDLMGPSDQTTVVVHAVSRCQPRCHRRANRQYDAAKMRRVQ